MIHFKTRKLMTDLIIIIMTKGNSNLGKQNKENKKKMV